MFLTFPSAAVASSGAGEMDAPGIKYIPLLTSQPQTEDWYVWATLKGALTINGQTSAACLPVCAVWIHGHSASESVKGGSGVILQFEFLSFNAEQISSFSAESGSTYSRTQLPGSSAGQGLTLSVKVQAHDTRLGTGEVVVNASGVFDFYPITIENDSPCRSDSPSYCQMTTAYTS